jgi:hypothetical protein
MNILQQAQLVIPQDITATGSGQDLSVQGFSGFGSINFQAYNKAGTSPTLTVVLQHSLPVANFVSQNPSGTLAGLAINGSASTNHAQAVGLLTTAAVTVKSVTVPLQQNSSVSQTATITCTLYADSSGPTGSALATSQTVLVSAIPTAYGNVTFTFTTPYDLSASTQYWFVFTASYSASTTAMVNIWSATVASGGNVSTETTSTWANNALLMTPLQVGTYSFSTFQTYQIATPGGARALTNLSLGSFTTGTFGPGCEVATPFYPQDTLGVIRALFTLGGTSSPEYLISASVAGFPVNSTPSTSV